MPLFLYLTARDFGVCSVAAGALPGRFQWDFLLPYLIIVALLPLGLSIALRNAPPGASLLHRFVLCGPVFFALPMVFFGTEHFMDPVGIGNIIPKWVPAHTFLAYFVGTCLIAGGLSILFRRVVGLAAGLAGVMFLFFEALIHLPLAVTVRPHNRLLWMVAIRDFCFSSGALALAATYARQWRVRGTHWVISAARLCIGVGITVYGVQHFLHPELLPGVPLRQLTPTFIPGHLLGGYLTAVAYLTGGIFLVIKIKERLTAAWLGVFIFGVVLIFCVPFPVTHGGTIGALNVPVDTLMFSGAVLCLSGSLAAKSIGSRNEADRLEPVVILSGPVPSEARKDQTVSAV